MLHPVGPLPRQTYWIRRALVVAVAVALLVGLLWWAMSGSSGPKDTAAAADTETTQPALTGALSARTSDSLVTGTAAGGISSTSLRGSSDTAPTAATTSSAAGEIEAGDDTAGGQTSASGGDDADGAAGDPVQSGNGDDGAELSVTSGGATDDAGDGTADGSASPDSESDAADATVPVTVTVTKTVTPSSSAQPTTTAPPKPSFDPSGNLICPDDAFAVTAGARSASYPVGAQPVLLLTVQNTGSKVCVRDVSGTLQTFTVYTADGDRVWSTDDCFPGEGTEVHRFTPGESRQYPVTWSGTTSEPGCSAPRTKVPAGEYEVVATLGKLSSKKASFTFK